MAALDDLRERLSALDTRQLAWRREFLAAYRRLQRERFGIWKRPNAAQRQELASQASQQAGQEQPRALFAFFDELCDAYRAETLPQNRAKLRADVGAASTLLTEIWAYAQQCVELVRTRADQVRLERALAAVSIDDLRADSEQVDALLCRIWLAALRAELDPRAAFESSAADSNPSTGGGGAFLQQHLRAFEGSAAYRAGVLPSLRRHSA